MKLSMFAAAAAIVLAGCATSEVKNADPVIGNWGLRLPYQSMSAGHVIFSRNAEGAPQALVLWRWSSPVVRKCEITGNAFTIHMPRNMTVTGEVQGDTLYGRVSGGDRDGGEIIGWRNKPIESANTADAKFGEPIDLLKDGLDGWETMNAKAKFGWSFKNGVLSNKLGLKPDGSWAGGGANLKSKRDDFFDFNLSYDVRVPKKSNSGVYLRGRYEIQVVDSYGLPVNEHNMAAYYGREVPLKAAEKKPGEWQHVDVTLYKRHLTVVLNGVTILDNVPVVGVTGGAIDAVETVPGPIYLQGDHSDADFRNMILRKAL